MILSVLALSLVLNAWNNEFPVFYHADESKKIRFVLNLEQDFHHPILMLQVVRLLNFFTDLPDRGGVIVLARYASAFFGMLIVLFAYLISRRVMAENYSRLAALAAALSPILVVHSHYYKEDVFFTAGALMSLYSFFKLADNPCARTIGIFGVACGIALASQYKAVLLLPIFLLYPAVIGGGQRGQLYRGISLAILVAIPVALLINYPLFSDVTGFLNGIDREANHVLKGHTLKLYPMAHWFSFHLLNSVLPGLTLPVAVVALAGIVVVSVHRASRTNADVLLLMYIMVFYFAHELTPMKAAPDSMRYMVPIAPMLILYASRGFHLLQTRLGDRRYPPAGKYILLLPALFALVIYPASVSLNLVYHLERDTREQAADWIRQSAGTAKYERYASNFRNRGDIHSITSLNIGDLKNQGVNYLVASSFQYGRYLRGEQLSGQKKHVYQYARRYRRLFQLPYVEIRPAYQSFAFSNPVIRIIDISNAEF